MLLPPRSRTVLTPTGEQVSRRPVPGDLRWDGKVWRRWNTRRWSRAAYSLAPGRLRDPARPTDGTRVSDGARERAMGAALRDQVLQHDVVVHLREPVSAVVGRLRPVNHWGHGLLTLLTSGLWGLAWVAFCLARTEDRILFVVDPWGHVWASPGRPTQVRRSRTSGQPPAARDSGS